MSNEFIVKNGLIVNGNIDATGNFGFSGDIIPKADDTSNLGSPSNLFSTVYVSTVKFPQSTDSGLAAAYTSAETIQFGVGNNRIVDQFPIANGWSVTWRIVTKNRYHNSHMRATTIQAVFSPSNVQYTETYTDQIGGINIEYTVAADSTNITLYASWDGDRNQQQFRVIREVI